MSVQYGERLAALRKAAALTQHAVAELAGLRRVHLSRLETGVLQCGTAATRRSLAKAYGVPFGVFHGYLEGEIALGEVVALRTAKPPVVNRPYGRPHIEHRSTEEVGLRSRVRCPECGAWTFRRVGEPDSRTRLAIDADEIDGTSDLDLRIEERFRRERIEGGAHLPLGECNEDAIYLEGDE